MSDKMKKRRLILVWPYVEWGGAQIYFLAIMKLAKKDWDILVLLPRDSRTAMLDHLDSIGVQYELNDTHSDMGPAPTLGRKIARQRRRVHDLSVIFKRLREFDLR